MPPEKPVDTRLVFRPHQRAAHKAFRRTPQSASLSSSLIVLDANVLLAPYKTSHSDTAFDVLALASILRVHATNIAGKNALTLSDVEQAETLADQLLSALGERVVSDEQASSAAVNRQRAFTLFVRAYDEMRRGLVFLRWHEGDADEIAPSLYSSRVGRRRRPEAEAEESETPNPAAPAAPAAGNGAPNGNAPVGHPDSAPFTS